MVSYSKEKVEKLDDEELIDLLKTTFNVIVSRIKNKKTSIIEFIDSCTEESEVVLFFMPPNTISLKELTKTVNCYSPEYNVEEIIEELVCSKKIVKIDEENFRRK